MTLSILAQRIVNAHWHSELRFNMARVSSGENKARLLRESFQWAREKEILMGRRSA